jgi:hypothetical protein
VVMEINYPHPGVPNLGRKQMCRSRNPGAAQMKMSVRRSPLGERLNAAPAERYSAKAKGEARGH